MITTFTQAGGARIGMLNSSWPFATLSASNEVLHVSAIGRDYSFPKSSIRSLRKHRGVFSTGLRIDHTQPSAPAFVVFWASLFFWTSGFQKLKTRLESLGYEIHD